jgi:hypothetical protein
MDEEEDIKSDENRVHNHVENGACRYCGGMVESDGYARNMADGGEAMPERMDRPQPTYDMGTGEENDDGPGGGLKMSRYMDDEDDGPGGGLKTSMPDMTSLPERKDRPQPTYSMPDSAFSFAKAIRRRRGGA